MTEAESPKMTEDVNVRGVSWFFYALVPWALSTGAAGWLAFGAGVHDAEQRAAAEKRIATAVGEAAPPTAPYKLTLKQGKFYIESARYDGNTLELYYHNSSHVRLYNYCFHYQQRAADGTVLGGDDQCFPGDDRALLPGERSELIDKFDVDSRTTEIVLSFDSGLEGND